MANNPAKDEEFLPKPESFGTVLSKAIDREYGSKVEFARAMGVSKGRISQILGGPAEVAPSTLRKVLRTFRSHGAREQVYAAWVREFAPEPDSFVDHANVAETVQRVGELWQSDHPRQALKLAKACSSSVTDDILWYELTGTTALLELRLGRPGAALTTVAHMLERAKDSGEQRAMLNALWLNSLAHLNVDGVTALQLDTAQQIARDYAESLSPRGDLRIETQTKRVALARDFALAVLALNDRRKVAEDLLKQAWSSVNAAFQHSENPLEKNLCLEVRARVEVALGHLVRAEDSLDEALEAKEGAILEFSEKVQISRARIAVARDKHEQAIDVLQTVADECLEKMNLHHLRVADQMLAQLRIGMFPPARPVC